MSETCKKCNYDRDENTHCMCGDRTTGISELNQSGCSVRPIKTAPKAGRILLFLEDCDWVIGEWNPDAFDGPRWEDDGLQTEAFICNPTHWMHLPEPPNQ